MRRLVLIISALAMAGRRTLLRWSAPFGVMIALGAPAGALASGDAETIHLGGSVTQASVNPCTGAAGTSHATFKSVSHTQPTYTGEFTAWDGQNGAVGSTITSTAAFHDTLRGSDGSSIRDRGVFHVAVRADGTVTAALDSFALVCG